MKSKPELLDLSIFKNLLNKADTEIDTDNETEIEIDLSIKSDDMSGYDSDVSDSISTFSDSYIDSDSDSYSGSDSDSFDSDTLTNFDTKTETTIYSETESTETSSMSIDGEDSDEYSVITYNSDSSV